MPYFFYGKKYLLSLYKYNYIKGMLRLFKVSNFKCFKEEFELNLSDTRGYEFNKECIDQNSDLIKSALIYGHNGCGKSNLTLAIFDIIAHLTDKEKDSRFYQNYLNAYSQDQYASFHYEFIINSKLVVYEYKKLDYKTIVFERLIIDNKEVILFDRIKNAAATILLEGTESLNTEITNSELSVLKYVKSNSELADNEVNNIFKEIFRFVDGMLFFRSIEFNTYLGFRSGSEDYLIDIINSGKVDEFQTFLNEANVRCKLKVVEDTNGKNICFDFGDKTVPFLNIASTGTKSLALFFFWYQKLKEFNASFLLIDEFDAFYHNELSVLIVKKLKETGIQYILTSHNLSIMTNDLLRPDCYFSMTPDKIVSFANLTEKELRYAHNLEKMYKAGAFNVN